MQPGLSGAYQRLLMEQDPRCVIAEVPKVGKQKMRKESEGGAEVEQGTGGRKRRKELEDRIGRGW